VAKGCEEPFAVMQCQYLTRHYYNFKQDYPE